MEFERPFAGNDACRESLASLRWPEGLPARGATDERRSGPNADYGCAVPMSTSEQSRKHHPLGSVESSKYPYWLLIIDNDQ